MSERVEIELVFNLSLLFSAVTRSLGDPCVMLVNLSGAKHDTRLGSSRVGK